MLPTREELAFYLSERAKGQTRKQHAGADEALSEARELCAGLKHQAASTIQLLDHLRQDPHANDEVAVIGRSRWTELGLGGLGFEEVLPEDSLYLYQEEEEKDSATVLQQVAERAAKRLEERAAPSTLRTKMSVCYDHVQSKVSCASPTAATSKPLHGRRSIPLPNGNSYSAPSNVQTSIDTRSQPTNKPTPHSSLTVRVPGAAPGYLASPKAGKLSEPLLKINSPSSTKATPTPSRRRASLQLLDEAAMSAAKLIALPSRRRRSVLESALNGEPLPPIMPFKREPESPKKISWSSLYNNSIVPAKQLVTPAASSSSIGGLPSDIKAPIAGRRAHASQASQ